MKIFPECRVLQEKKTDEEHKKPQSMPISTHDMMEHSFKYPPFKEIITPVLAEMVRSLIQETEL